MKHFAIHVLHLAGENTKASLPIRHALLDDGRFIRIIKQKKQVVFRKILSSASHIEP